MKNWKNPYVTLKLCPYASTEDIRKAGNLVGLNREDVAIAKLASAELKDKTELIIPAFLTAIDDIISLESDIKQLNKIVQISRFPSKINDEIKQDAFQQIRINSSESKTEITEINLSDIDTLSSAIGLKELYDDYKKTETKTSNQEIAIRAIQSDEKSMFKIPQIIT